MNDDSKTCAGENQAIPTLDVMVADGDGEPCTLAELERLTVGIERELRCAFEETVILPVNEALRDALASYREKTRSLVLRELASKLGRNADTTDPE